MVASRELSCGMCASLYLVVRWFRLKTKSVGLERRADRCIKPTSFPTSARVCGRDIYAPLM